MTKKSKEKQLTEENQELRARLEELEETVHAIQNGEVDALVISGTHGEQVYTLKDENYPYRIIIESINEGAVNLSKEGTILYSNTRFADMVKLPLEKMINSSFFDFVSAEDKIKVHELIKQGSHGSSKGKFNLITISGTLLTVNLSLSAVQIDGKPSLSMIVTDLTTLERAGRALKMLYDCNQIIVHATDETDFLHDICKTIVQVGGYRMAWVGFAEQDRKKTVRPAAQFGYENGYLETLNITWADAERGRGPTGTAIRTGQPSVGRNLLTGPAFKPWRAEALKRGYASSISLPLIAQGRTLGSITMYAVEPDAFDIDELKLLKELADDISNCISTLRLREEHKRTDQELREHREHLEEMVEKRTEELKKVSDELARSNTDLQQFAYVASHDLQEPLQMIRGFLTLFEKRYKDKLDEKAGDLIRFSAGCATRMQQLIKDLLEYSRVGAKDKRFKPTDCSLILNDAIPNLKAAIEQSGGEVTHDDLPTVLADASQLSSLFQNLIGNALKFHGAEAPRVHISAARKGNEWLFSVRDNGIGIDPKYADRIFSVFQRLHSSDEYPGTGIGLAICKKIVEGHGGKIWIESEPGKGATFFFTIPDQEKIS